MTADEVRGVVFQKATVGGYKPSDVDIFLDEVAVCIESMAAKIKELENQKAELLKAQQNSADAPVRQEPVKREVEAPKEETSPTYDHKDEQPTNYGIETLLIKAQKLAEEIETEARDISEQLIERATIDAKDIIEKADAEAEDTIEKANLILAEAERKEETMSTAARQEAENIINDAVARAGQILSSTREQLKNDQDSCAKLREEFKKAQTVMASFYKEKLKEIEDMKLVSPADISDDSSNISSYSQPKEETFAPQSSEEVEESESDSYAETLDEPEVNEEESDEIKLDLNLS